MKIFNIFKKEVKMSIQPSTITINWSLPGIPVEMEEKELKKLVKKSVEETIEGEVIDSKMVAYDSMSGTAKFLVQFIPGGEDENN